VGRLPLVLYNVAACSAVPLVLPVLALHPRLRGGLGQRLGAADGGVETVGPRVWLHGSSAGDVGALIPLGRRLGRAGLHPVYSAWTRSGYELARRRLAPDATVFHAPLDLAPLVGRVLDRLRPSLLVLECLELWPALVSGCVQREIPVAVVNGRMSERSLRGYVGAGWLFGPCFRSLALVAALSDGDAERFVRAGVPRSRVHVESSSKHGDPECGSRSAREPPLLVLGSIHRAEEEALLPWVPRLLARVPGLRVVVAPRYPHRAPEIRRRLDELGIFGQRVTVVGTMGDLATHYGAATVAFVGGSLIPHGGHNLVEAAARGAAVLTGPYTTHCADEAARLVAARAAVVVCDGPSFCDRALDLLLHREATTRTGERGQQVARELSGAADRLARRLATLSGGGPGGQR